MANLYYDGIFYVKNEGRRGNAYRAFCEFPYVNGVYGYPAIKLHDHRIKSFLYEVKDYFKEVDRNNLSETTI